MPPPTQPPGKHKPFDPKIPVTQKAKKTGTITDQTVFGWLIGGPGKQKGPLARYAGQVGTIQARAKVYGFSPVELIILLASTGTEGTNAGIDGLLGANDAWKTRADKTSLQAWAAQYGYSINTSLVKFITAKAKGSNYTQPFLYPHGPTPNDTVIKKLLGTQETSEITSMDKWVVVTKTGKTGATITGISTVPITQFAADGKTPLPVDANGKPIKNIVKSNGQPLTQQGLLQAIADYNEIWDAYGGGGRLSPTQVANIVHKGLSAPAIQTMFSNLPSFKKSRVYQAHAPAIIGLGKDMFGAGWKPDQGFIAKAIAGNWDQATIVQKFKEMPAYLKGPQYRQQTSALSNVHMSIMGSPSQQDLVNIHEAALQGWSADEYAAWVRGTKAYKFGPEAQSYALHIADALGLITGKQAKLTPGGSTGLVPKQPPGGAAPVNSPRIPGKPAPVAPGNNLGVSY